MNRGRCDVNGIRPGPRWEWHIVHEGFCQCGHLRCLLQERHVGQGGESLRSGSRVARLTFDHDQL